MIIEEAIRHAKSHDWDDTNFAYSTSDASFLPTSSERGDFYDPFFGMNVPVVDGWRYGRDMFLDPQFWQSLGKAIGWDDQRMMVQLFTDHDRDSATVNGAPRWKYELHRFIDHLAEGKTPESFFRTLK